MVSRLVFDRNNVSTDNVVHKGHKDVTNSFERWLDGLSEKGCFDGVMGWVEVHEDDTTSNCLEMCMAMKSLLSKYVNGFGGGK